MSNLDDFMAEFWEATEQNPFAHHERIWQRRAAFEIRPFDGTIRLGCIRSLERGHGHGTAALVWLTALADKHRVTISGDIQPVGSIKPRLTALQLRAWYRRYGFKVEDKTITRQPQEIG